MGQCIFSQIHTTSRQVDAPHLDMRLPDVFGVPVGVEPIDVDPAMIEELANAEVCPHVGESTIQCHLHLATLIRYAIGPSNNSIPEAAAIDATVLTEVPADCAYEPTAPRMSREAALSFSSFVAKLRRDQQEGHGQNG